MTRIGPDKTRFLMIGGFLGAGKTTTIARLAKHYIQLGQRVAVVTNDQATGLVDTATLRAAGLDVGEVPGACFCCKFDELVDVAAALATEEQPDVILTEPVGSCTDLVSTVIEPLRQIHGDRYEVGKLAVLCKPEHGRKILGGAESGFSPKAAYIFLKQLEEADVIVINKADTLSGEQRAELTRLVSERFPQQTAMAASGKTGEGFERLTQLLDGPRAERSAAMPMDYDVYAEGEAEMAWLNATVDASSLQPFELDQLSVEIINQLATLTATDGFEPAHIKVLGFAEEETCVANLVSSDAEVELSLASEACTTAARLLVNARVAGDPDRLRTALDNALTQIAEVQTIELNISEAQHFRPGRPEPTHRFA